MFVPFVQRASHLPQHPQVPTHPSLHTGKEGTRISEGSLRLPQLFHLPSPSPFVLQGGRKSVKGSLSSPSWLLPFCVMQCRLNWRQRKHLELNPLLSTPCQSTRIHYLLSYAIISHTLKPAAGCYVPLHSPNNPPFSTVWEPTGHKTLYSQSEKLPLFCSKGVTLSI